MLTIRSLSLIALAAGIPAADSSYLVPVMPGVIVRPIATAGDALPAGAVATGVAIGGGATKTVVGVPDGLGAFDNGDGTFTLVANHELGRTSGTTRDHGQAGSFVSRLVINSSSLAVGTLSDQISSVLYFSAGGGTWSGSPSGGFTAALDRLCSGDLPAPTAFYNSANGKGLPPTNRFFMSGEETSIAGGSPTGGRAFAHAVSGAYAGQSVQLPHLGLAAWENLVACPFEQDLTVVIALDDTTPGQLYVYTGQKQTLAAVDNNAVDWARAAGLVGGTLSTVVANGQLYEQRTAEAGFVGVGAGKGVALRFGLSQVAPPATVAAYTADTAMDARTATVGGTYFLRPEDGAWDPVNQDTFYFLTTDRFDTVKNGGSGAASATIGRTRLWRLQFDSIANPSAGGTITMLIDGSEDPGPQMLDNLTVDRFGRVVMQEDPGNADHAAAVWVYDTNLGTLHKVAKHDPSRFGDRGYGSAGVDGAKLSSVVPFDAGAAKSDEESSGIIDAQELLGPGWFLCGVQAHSSTGMDATTVERGQIDALYVPFTAAAGGTVQPGNLATLTFGTSALPVRDGGMGSSLAVAPGRPGQFWGLTDRGPNVAHPTDGSAKLFPAPTFSPNLRRMKMNGDGTVTILEQIVLKRSDGTTPLTGKPLPSGTDGWSGETAYAVDAAGTIGAAISDPSGLDSEGLVAAPDGTFWISDEYGPFIAHFAADGHEIERFSPFAAGSVSGLKLPSVLRQREANRGMESLCLTPDGTKLVGMMQSPLANAVTPADLTAGSGSGQSRRMLAARIVEITIATGSVREFVYLTETRSTSVCEIVALGGSSFLVLERDGNFPTVSGAVKRVYRIDISAATDIHDPDDGINGKLFTQASVTDTLERQIKLLKGNSPTFADVTAALTTLGVTPVTKTLAVDLATYKSFYNHDKMEGMALVGSTLYIINDDDFGITDEDADGAKNSDVGANVVLPKIIHGSTTTQNVGGSSVKNGLQDYTQILQVDLAQLGVAVTSANATPSLSLPATLSVAVKGTVTGSVLVGDVETAADGLSVSAISGNSGTATATISGSGSTRTLTVDGVHPGVAIITVSVSDGVNTRSATVSATVTGDASGSDDDNKGSNCGSGSNATAILCSLLGLGLFFRRRR